jgi:hypothetical protein
MASCSGCMRAHCNGRRGPELPQRPGALGPLTILSAPNTNSHGECWDMVLMDGEMLMQDLKSDEYVSSAVTIAVLCETAIVTADETSSSCLQPDKVLWAGEGCT